MSQNDDDDNNAHWLDQFSFFSCLFLTKNMFHFVVFIKLYSPTTLKNIEITLTQQYVVDNGIWPDQVTFDSNARRLISYVPLLIIINYIMYYKV